MFSVFNSETNLTFREKKSNFSNISNGIFTENKSRKTNYLYNKLNK